MEFKDYYQILNVDNNADQATIKKTFRRLARKYHPDVSTEENAEEKFKEVKEAYEVLKDIKKRQAYDQLYQQQQQQSNQDIPPNWDYQSQSGDADHDNWQREDLSDFFHDLFGDAAKHRYQQDHMHQATKGRDQHATIDISLDESFHGSTKKVQLQQPSLNPETGHVSMTSKTIDIKIPQGVTNKQQLRLKGQGLPGVSKGQPGDLYIEICIKPHSYFTFQKRDIFLTVPITLWEATLGSHITVPTLSGPIKMNIPADTPSGKKLRLKGKGLPGKTPGDQIISIQISPPTQLSEQQKQLLKQCQTDIAYNPRENVFK